jgi:hypothetical protein
MRSLAPSILTDAASPCYFLLRIPLRDLKCNRLADLAYYPVSLASALPSHVLDTFKMSHGLRSSGSTFMYLYHLISIDLQLSCSFNTHTLQSLHLLRYYYIISSSSYNILYSGLNFSVILGLNSILKLYTS